MNRERTRAPRRTGTARATAVALALALALAGCSTVDQALEVGKGVTPFGSVLSQAQSGLRAGSRVVRAAAPIDARQEHFIGRAVSAEILARPGMEVAGDRSVPAYVSNVGQALVLASPNVGETYQGYRFVLLDSPSANAISTPGGYVFVTRGLLALARSEDELAAALAHEVAHVHLGHGLAAIRQSNLTEAAKILGTEAAHEMGGELAGLFGSSVQDVVAEVFTKGFSREQESAADALAVRILADAGYSPGALATLLERANFDGGGFRSDHPSAGDRVAAVRAATGGLPAARGVEVRTARFEKSLRR